MNRGKDMPFVHKHQEYRTSTRWRTAGGIPIIVLALMILTNCSSPRFFSSSPGEYERQQVHTYPFNFDIAWKSARDAVSNYRLHTKDPVNGILLTWWRSTIVKEVGALSENRNFMHGVKIEDRSDGGTRERGEFEVKNRLEIRVIRDSDSTTTVTVKNIFKITPYDLTPKEHTTDPFANKVFSPTEFDTREEYRILNRIEEIAAKKAEKKPDISRR